jgi:hypothetical protein
MPKALRPHLIFSNILSVIAVFLALGGASYAAISLPKNSVGTAQIRAGAVTAGKLADESVGGNALSDGVRASLDRAGPPGPRGEAGPAGPQGPGATRIHLSRDGTPSATPQPIATVGGLTLKAACDTTSGQTSLVFAVDSEEAGTIQENFQNDTGSDPHTPGPLQSGNLQVDIPAGANSNIGGPPAVPSGTFYRIIASLIFTTATKTASIQLAAIVDGSAAHCNVDGVGVAAS